MHRTIIPRLLVPFIIWRDDSLFVYVDVFVLTASQGTGSQKKIDGLDIVTANINIKISLSLECRRFLRYTVLDFDSTSFLQRLCWQKTSNRQYFYRDTCVKTVVACSCPSSLVLLQIQTKFAHIFVQCFISASMLPPYVRLLTS